MLRKLPALERTAMSILNEVTTPEQSRALERIVQAVEWGCQPCKGSGRNLAHALVVVFGPDGGPCHACHGTGNAGDHYHPYADLGAWLAAQKCRECKGVGGFAERNGPTDVEQYACDSCGGTGKESEWPAAVWWCGYRDTSQEWRLDLWQPGAHLAVPSADYVPALSLLQALAVLEECAGWFWNKLDGAQPWKAWRAYPGITVAADSLPELLAKCLEVM